jgi:DNA polymerase-3 subunit delta'
MLLMDFPVNQKVIIKLSTWALANRVSHAYIFQGDKRIDKRLLAKAFAKAILCKSNPGKGCLECQTCRKIDGDNYEDLLFVQGAGASLQDSMLNDLLVNLKTKPIGGARNIAIIENADTMTIYAQNRLLKTLEEPNPGAVIILLSENVERLVSTISSRCVLVAFEGFNRSFNSEAEAMAMKLASTIDNNGTFRDSRNVVQDLLKDKENGRGRTMEFLDYLQGCYSNRLKNLEEDESSVDVDYIVNIVGKIEVARKSVEKNGSYTYALKNMLLGIGG